jgi:histidinol phosphatase-like enzyme
MNNKIIAIDFDGTIVEDKYPEIGKPLLFAFDVMKKLQEKCYRVVLWNYRNGKKIGRSGRVLQKERNRILFS